MKPNQQGQQKSSNLPSWDQIVAVLAERVNPRLASHDGSIHPLTLLTDGTLQVRFGGACRFCPASEETIRELVITTLDEAFPQAALKVEVVRTVSNELIQQAKAILNKSR